MRQTVTVKLHGALTAAVAVEWTDVDTPLDSAAGWQACLRLANGDWRFANHGAGPDHQGHWRAPGRFANIALRYRLSASGPWSPISTSRKEITLIAADDPAAAPAPLAAEQWSALERLDLGGGVFTGAFALFGAAAEAVAVEWTSGAEGAWNACTALDDGRWRLAGYGAGRAHLLAAGDRLDGIGLRYRLVAGGLWSPVSTERRLLDTSADQPDPFQPPVLILAPALIGTGKIGAEIRVTPGQWGGWPVPDLALQWRRDGVEIAGATGSVYVPGAADDRTDLTCRVRAASLAGSAEIETASVSITHLAPEAVGEMPEEIFDGDSGLQTVAAADYFTGANLRFAVTGAGAAIDAATGVISIPTDAIVGGEPVTVTARNSGGQAEQVFWVTVEGAEFPEKIDPALFAVSEIRSGTQIVGQRQLVVGNVIVPAGFELCWGSALVTGGVASGSVVVTPNATFTRSNALAVGAINYNVLWWRRIEDRAYANALPPRGVTANGLALTPVPGASVDGQVIITVLGALPVSGWRALSRSHLSAASAADLTRHFESPTHGCNAATFGQPAVALAYAAFAGDAGADSRLSAQIAHSLGGANMPLACGGVQAQFECRTAAMFAIVRRTPRIWNGLTATQRNQIDALMKGILIDAAWMGSDSHPFEDGAGLTLRGTRRKDRSVGSNFSNAIPARVLICLAYFGSAAAVSGILETYDHAAFRSELTTLFGNGANMTRTFRWPLLGVAGSGNFIGGSSAGAPDAAAIQSALRNWRYYGRAVGDVRGLFLPGSQSMSKMLGATVQSGLNGGAGATGDRSRGKIAQNASGTPHLGLANSMFNEFDSQDESGERSSAGYVTWGLRNWTDVFLALEVAGAWDRTDAEIRTMLARFHRAMEVWRYFTEQGYHSWAHGGDKGGGGGSPATWNYTTASDWNLPLTRDLWFEVLAPKFGL